MHETPQFEVIAKSISDGFPIVAHVNNPGEEDDHWVVVYGFRRRPPPAFRGGKRFPVVFK